jgi:hypothetical protein
LLWLVLAAAFALGIRWSLHASYSERFAIAQKAVGDTLSTSKAERSQSASEPSKTGRWLLFAIANSPWATGLIVLVWAIRKFPGAGGKTLFEIELEKYIDRPDFKGKAAFVDAFTEDFGKAVRAYAPRGPAKIFIFVDDLDRCEVPKAADIMQAINLMIGDGSPLFFVIGLDRAKVASSIAFKFREIAPYLFPKPEPTAGATAIGGPSAADVRAFGDEFLEKFIQISFRIPTSDSDQQAVEFINSLISAPADSANKTSWLYHFFPWLVNKGQAPPVSANPAVNSQSDRDPFRVEAGPESDRIRSIVLSVSGILGHNPRRIKAFLNRFRLSLYIASSQGLLDKDPSTGKAEVTPETLGKFIALTSAYPDILAEFLASPSLFSLLEFYLTWDEAKESEKAYIFSWLNKPGIRALVSPPKPLTVEWQKTYSLAEFPVSKFLRILPPIPAPPKRNVETQGQDAPVGQPTLVATQLDQSTSSSTSSDSPWPPTDPTLDPQGAKPETRFSVSIRQVAGSEPKEEAPAARTASAEVRFSEPRGQDEEPAAEREEAGQDSNDSQRDMDSASETEGGRTASKSSNVTGGTIKQIR